MISFIRRYSLAPKSIYRFCLKTPASRVSFRLYCDYVPPPHMRLPQWYYDYINLSPPVEVSTMPKNGLKVATMSRETRTVCVGLFFDTGPKNEDGVYSGISNFFEHIVYTSTISCNAALIANRMSGSGAHFKAFTISHMVGFYAECLCEDIETIVAVISECVLYNSYSDEAIMKALKIVLDEMEERRGDLDAQLYDYLIKSAFQGTRLGNTVYGPSYNICNYNKKNVSIFILKYFMLKYGVLSSCGAVIHDQMVSYAEKYLSINQMTSKVTYPYRYTGSEVSHRDDSLPMANVAIAMEAPGFGHLDNYALDLARELVGNWDRRQCGTEDHPTFFGQAANYHHLSGVKSFHIKFKEAGLWGAQFMCPTADIDNMMFCVTDSWMHLCVTTTNLELEKAKSQLKLKMLLKSESHEDSMIDMAKWILYKGWMPTLEDRLRCVESVSESEMRNVCYKYIYDKCPVVASVGATALMPAYNRVHSSFWWVRY